MRREGSEKMEIHKQQRNRNPGTHICGRVALSRHTALFLYAGLAGFVGQDESAGVSAKEQDTFWDDSCFSGVMIETLAQQSKKKKPEEEVMFKAQYISFLFSTSSNEQIPCFCVWCPLSSCSGSQTCKGFLYINGGDAIHAIIVKTASVSLQNFGSIVTTTESRRWPGWNAPFWDESGVVKKCTGPVVKVCC